MSSSRTSKGIVFTWGSDKDTGALGHKQKDKDGHCPMPLAVGLSDCVEVCAAANLSAAITSKGELYTWGKGPALGHGLGDTSVVLKPTMVKMMKPYFVTKISFGSMHALCLCRGDKGVYTWGSNKRGQLGIGAQVKGGEPYRVVIKNVPMDYEEEQVMDIQCCDNYSAAITSSGKLFTWGTSICLGHTPYKSKTSSIESSTEYLPKQVVDSIGHEKVIQASLGSNYMGCCCENGVAYAWGYGGHGNLGLGDRKSRGTPSPITDFYCDDIDIVQSRKAKAIQCTHSQISMGGGMFPKNPGQEGPHTLLIVEEEVILKDKTKTSGGSRRDGSLLFQKDADEDKISEVKEGHENRNTGAGGVSAGAGSSNSLPTIMKEGAQSENRESGAKHDIKEGKVSHGGSDDVSDSKSLVYEPISTFRGGDVPSHHIAEAKDNEQRNSFRTAQPTTSSSSSSETRTSLYSFGTCHKGLCGNLFAKTLSGPYDELIPYRIGSKFRDVLAAKKKNIQPKNKPTSSTSFPERSLAAAAADGKDGDTDEEEDEESAARFEATSAIAEGGGGGYDINTHQGREKLLGNVVGASASSIHNLVWNDKGELYAFGCGSGGRCGVGYFLIGANPNKPRKSRMKAYMSAPNRVGCSWPSTSYQHKASLQSLGLRAELDHVFVTQALASRYHGICIADLNNEKVL